MRLQQITCGHFTSDDGVTQPIANNRITELMNVLDETEGKAIIWAHYQYDMTTIIKAVTENNNTSFTAAAVCFEDQGESEKKLQEIKGIMF